MGLGLLLAVLRLAGPASAQEASPDLELSFRDGRVVAAADLEGSPDRGGRFRARGAGKAESWPAGSLLAVRGVAVQPVALASAHLEGGEVLRGALLGGDPNGDSLTLLSPVLGTVTVPVDRLSAFVPARSEVRPDELSLPDGVDEALFTPARIGFDLVAGSLFRFTNRGVRFAADDREDADDYRLEEFAALRIRDPVARERPVAAWLVTRSGDRLGVGACAFGADGVSCELESGRVAEVRWSDLASLTFLAGAVFLSDLEPFETDEAGFDGPALYPFRRDESAPGGPLLAAGRTYAKGLGVHSRSRLSYRVPEGAAWFWTRVAFDDSSVGLPFVAEVDVRLLVGDREVFARRGVRAGDAPVDAGRIAVSPGEVLTLEVGFGRGRDLGDRVDWLMPVFLLPPGR